MSDDALRLRRELRLATKAAKESMPAGAEANERYATEVAPAILLEAARLVIDDGELGLASAMIEHAVHDGIPAFVLVDSAVRLATLNAMPARKAAAVKKAAAAIEDAEG